jgi:RNA polymerase sigma-70 factor (ECF subfamily)
MNAAQVIALPGSRDRDHDLAVRHRFGDETAFREIYDRFAPMVFNLCLRLAGDPTLAQDLSQEVFLRVFKGLPRYRGGSSLKTWIYSITLNHCRGRLGRRSLELEDWDAQRWSRGPVDPGNSPEQDLLARDGERRIAAALLALPVRFREAVVLRDLEGLSYEEIAAVLRVRTGTVRSRIARGRERLRLLLLEKNP